MLVVAATSGSSSSSSLLLLLLLLRRPDPLPLQLVLPAVAGVKVREPGHPVSIQQRNLQCLFFCEGTFLNYLSLRVLPFSSTEFSLLACCLLCWWRLPSNVTGLATDCLELVSTYETKSAILSLGYNFI